MPEIQTPFKPSNRPAPVTLDGVVRDFDGVRAVDHLSFTLAPGEFVTLLGPSGCGKTTSLRMLAGFETPDQGRILLGDVEIQNWSPQHRGFGMVFQSYALFPHLDVFENVAFGLRTRGISGPSLRDAVLAALDRVDLTGYDKRPVQALSGGQQQRVALARALAIEPPLLLLDEPLSNLDQALRFRTRMELRRLVRELGITALFVTHDQEEAFDLSDRIAVMRDGRLLQMGPPDALYLEPVDPFVAGFMGRVNSFRVVLESGGLRLPTGARWPLPSRVPPLGPGRDALLVVRPEALRFTQADEGSADATTLLQGLVTDVRFRGAQTLYLVTVAALDAPLEVLGPADGPRVGARVTLTPADPARIHVYPLLQEKA
jgi:ABC-type Fe3+/spermidine/putrescine transport system ATPase subunit